MKIITIQDNLKSGLFLTNHLAGKNVNLPILNNILLSAEEGVVKITATNLEIGITTTIRGKIEKPGKATIDSKIISDYISLLPNKKISIEQREQEVFINAENYKTKIKAQSAEEFPLIPEVDKKNFFDVSQEELKEALSQVVFAAANNETRMELCGVLFQISKEELFLAATDSYRLAEKKIKIKNSQTENRSVIVPLKTAQELLRILSTGGLDEIKEEGGGGARFYVSDNQLLFVYSSTELVSRLIEGQYPDYRQIIPTNSKTTAMVNREEFMRAIKIASLFSKNGINDINLDCPGGKNQLIISSVSGQTGENITELEARVIGADNGIVINYRYLLDGLTNIKGEMVKIEITNGNTPCILKPEKDETYLYIIMPIKQ